jgi:SAM-dependent methyltransferase
MKDVPHSYVVKGRTLGDDDFEHAVRVINTFGQPGKFHSSTRIYLTVGTTKWWTMGWGLGSTIINQATTEKVYGRQDAPSTRSGIPSIYDEVAVDYDARYDNPAAQAENDQIVKLIRLHFGPYAPTTLDVGAGTGLLLDLGVTAPGLYTGIDPSQGMLNELIRKHPKIRDIYPARLEDVIDTSDFSHRKFELVVSLFGAASYLPPDTIPRLASMTTGLLVLMNYREGYLPDFYGTEDDPDRHVPEHLHTSLAACRSLVRDLPGTTTHFLNSFEVTVHRCQN